MIGLIDRERVDTQLYDDYETEKARGVREFCVYYSLLRSDQILVLLRSYFLVFKKFHCSVILVILIFVVVSCYVEKVSKGSSSQ